MSHKALILLLAAVLTGGLAGCGRSTHTAYVPTPGANRVAGFRVDSKGQLTNIVGSPFISGASPSSIALDSSHGYAFVTNQAENDISRFKVDSSSGALLEMLPRTKAGTGPSADLVDAGGHLLVLNRVSANISVYMIGSDGTLTEIAGSPFAILPSSGPNSITLAPSGKFLYVPLLNLGAVAGFTVGSDGSLQTVPGSPFPAGSGPTSVTVNSGESFAYVTNSLGGDVTIFSIDGTTGALGTVPGSPFVAGTNPIASIFDSTGTYLYIANFGSSNISAYTVDSTTGIPTQLTKSPFTAGSNPVALAIDPNTMRLYSVNQGAKDISQFTVADTGDLTAGATTNTGVATSIVFGP